MDYRNWFLFLDRDGVINVRLPGQYVTQWEEFEFFGKALDALCIFSDYFSRVFVVTNQQGVGKGLMTTEQLEYIHRRMSLEIEASSGHIDAIYYCPDLASAPNTCRKPASKMAIQAKAEYPEIEFSKSVMIGDSLSDIEFGKRLGMQTVLIESNKETLSMLEKEPHLGHQIDFHCSDLMEFANLLV